MQKNKLIAILLASVFGACTLGASADSCIVQGPYGPITVTCTTPPPPPPVIQQPKVYIPGQTCDYVQGPYGIIKLPACPK